MGIRLYRISYPVTVLGPGKRLGIWFQGCSIGCRGCMSKDTWDPTAGQDVAVDDIVGLFRRLIPEGLTGVTISGGEPFEQPGGLYSLLTALRREASASATPIDVLCYSGRSYRSLRTDYPDILDLLDVLIPEPFLVDRPVAALRGSDNQRIVLLSELGRIRFRDSETADRRLQVVVDRGRVQLVGIPRRGDLRRFVTGLEESGISVMDCSWE